MFAIASWIAVKINSEKKQTVAPTIVAAVFFKGSNLRKIYFIQLAVNIW